MLLAYRPVSAADILILVIRIRNCIRDLSAWIGRDRNQLEQVERRSIERRWVDEVVWIRRAGSRVNKLSRFAARLTRSAFKNAEVTVQSSSRWHKGDCLRRRGSLPCRLKA